MCDPAVGGCVFDYRFPGSPTCGGPLGICDQATGACVACHANSDCTNSLAPLCNTVSEACATCLTASDCPSYLLPGCADGVCGACLGASNCASGESSVAIVGRTGPTAYLGACQCQGTQGCGVGDPVCVVAEGEDSSTQSGCGCGQTSDCTSDKVCDFDHTCVPPCTSVGCNTGNEAVGDTSNGVCVECVANSDCSPAVCANNACVNCNADPDCTSNPYGGHSFDGGSSDAECGCTTNSDCTNTFLGGACVAGSVCGCNTNADCAGVPAAMGAPNCMMGVCSE